MSNSAVFPYGITLRDGGAIDIFPAVEAEFLGKNGEWVAVFLIIDSGAFVSALPKSDAVFFGIDVEKGRPTHVLGVNSGSVTGWEHYINVRFGKNFLKIPFVFLDNPSAPRVLGRAGVFEKFTIIFEEKSKRSGFLSLNSKEVNFVSKILDGVSQKR